MNVTHAAKIHTGGAGTIRNTIDKKQRKQVYKPILDSPYTLKWPDVQLEVLEEILTLFQGTLSPVGEYKRARRATRIRKKPRREGGGGNASVGTDAPVTGSTTTSAAVPVRPDALVDALVIGINDVAKALESQSRPSRSSAPPPLSSRKEKFAERGSRKYVGKEREMDTKPDIKDASNAGTRRRGEGDSDSDNNDDDDTSGGAKEAEEEVSRSPIRIVILMKGDINPPHLYMHLPILAAQADGVRIVALPRGSQGKIAECLEVPKPCVVGIRAGSLELEYLCGFVESKIPRFEMPWIIPIPSHTPVTSTPITATPVVSSSSDAHYRPTTIKTLITSAPITQKKTPASKLKKSVMAAVP